MSGQINDQVPADCAGAREIGFSVPQVYNASRVLFDNVGKGHGDKLALIGPAGTRTYAELCQALTSIRVSMRARSCSRRRSSKCAR